WTTTPWTLTGHTGLAVHPELVYRVVEDPSESGRLLLLGGELETPVPVEVEQGGEGRRLDLREAPALARIRGRALHGLRYRRPFEVGGTADVHGEPAFDPAPSDEDGWRVFTAEYVTASEGTGLVHTAPAFGEDDYRAGERYGLPFVLTVTSEGTIERRPGIEAFAGMWFKEADKAIQRDLKERRLLLHQDRYHHNYPFCWRCDQPLIYYASRSWFVRTTQVRETLLAENAEIDWHPEHVREGRFGNWLENVVDWALSRKRYWGTPLPIWRCDRCDHAEAIGSFEELFAHAGRVLPDDPYDRDQFDPHRPFVDREAPDEPFVWPCPAAGCDGTVGRVDDVIDAWYDSGSMPFAQHHYTGEPVETDDGSLFDPTARQGFPAHFISEAVDQTRGWFYTLHALGVLLFGSKAYRTCIVLGHVNDENGRKMSKRLGNVVDPMEVVEETGADALRWYFCVNNPEVNSRFSARLVREAAQRFQLPLWNALSFFTIYANLDDWRPAGEPEGELPDFDDRPALDRWILLRLDGLIETVTASLDSYEVTPAAADIERFVDDLTNWYIRRSRDRFWAPVETAADTTEGSDGGGPERGAAKASAYHSLYEVLTTLARLVAPFTPFLAEELYSRLVRSQSETAADSVHLTAWPEPSSERAEPALERGIAAVQRVVRLGHAARNTHGLKTRQPLASVTLISADEGLRETVAPYQDLLLEELNVKEVRWAEDRSAYVHHEVRPVFPVLGPRFGKRMPQVKAALEAADGDRLAARLEADGAIELELDGEKVELGSDEVEVRLVEKEGTATAGDRDLLVALDTRLDEALVAEGLAREVVHRIQTARKEADLDYADRIEVRYRADDDLAGAIRANRDWIRRETLAVRLEAVDGGDDLTPAAIGEHQLALTIEPV
ncbi:MAG: class I tRNA ligase family protein, partial [Thermoanaerobaculia bacterium]|nr:class I tRNA ligase family protein [Thermoanaerobaculia bacterium]